MEQLLVLFKNNALIASRAKKTANTIDISDPKVAEDFTNFYEKSWRSCSAKRN